jgi:signal peptidase I
LAKWRKFVYNIASRSGRDENNMIEASENADTVGADSALTMREKIMRELKEWGATLMVFVPLFLLFSGLVYEQRVIPSESMVPTLQVGDRIAVNKFAYGYGRHSLPFSLGRLFPIPKGRIFARSPKRGDVVVFEHTHTPRVMVKRLIGLPGDQVQMINEELYVNGAPVAIETVRTVTYRPHKDPSAVSAREVREGSGEKTWLTYRTISGDQGDDTLLFVVPAGQMLMMGDNRDNSLDSRFLSGHCPEINGVIDRTGCPLSVPADRASIGFVPMNNLIGRADTVVLTVHRCKLQDGAKCAKRVWKGL